MFRIVAGVVSVSLFIISMILFSIKKKKIYAFAGITTFVCLLLIVISGLLFMNQTTMAKNLSREEKAQKLEETRELTIGKNIETLYYIHNVTVDLEIDENNDTENVFAHLKTYRQLSDEELRQIEMYLEGSCNCVSSSTVTYEIVDLDEPLNLHEVFTEIDYSNSTFDMASSKELTIKMINESDIIIHGVIESESITKSGVFEVEVVTENSIELEDNQQLVKVRNYFKGSSETNQYLGTKIVLTSSEVDNEELFWSNNLLDGEYILILKQTEDAGIYELISFSSSVALIKDGYAYTPTEVYELMEYVSMVEELSNK